MGESVELESLRALVATRARRMIVWCGSGLSAAAGIPTWVPLQRRLEAQLSEKLESLDDPQREAKVRAIKQENSPWVAFERLQNALGITSFRTGVRQALGRASSVDVPDSYKLLWQLRPAGLINCNIDRLATRAFLEVGGNGVIEFRGKDVGPHTYTLSNRRPFICNIHGVEEDADSWIFTQQALRDLAGSDAYRNYIQSAFSSAAVLFVGISADDLSVGGHLERLQGIGAHSGPHYWISDRRDSATDAWAEKNNVLMIRYRATAGHPELLALLSGLMSHVQPDDDQAPPVALEIGFESGPIELPADLARREPEHIRTVLNAKAAEILRQDGDGSIAKYEEFSRQYDRAVHASWYTSVEPSENAFLGLRLEEEVARGAFGIVFRAKDEDGSDVAVKLLHAEIRKKKELLHAFRRGARSMRILAERKVPGIVRFRAASEFPATLIMEWIAGQNLAELVATGQFVEWGHILDVASQLTNIIADAHGVPERVLHRDIRPANVMVDGFWQGDPLQVRVLDFDLSWHRGSVEKSVIFGSQLSGYLAPEQIQRKVGVSTQHASVDSYGLGMTIFFMVSGRDPSPAEHAHGGWRAALLNECRRPKFASWKSTPNRMFRLIFAATQEHQEARWDVSQIRSELATLKAANLDSGSVQSAEFWAEELAARSAVLDGYGWNDANFSVEKDFGTGLSVSLRGDELRKSLQLEMTRVGMPSDDRNRMVDSLHRARDATVKALEDSGWEASGDIGQSMLSVTASADVVAIASRPERFSEGVRKACDRMTFN